jgi:hypothetical protein
MTCSQPRPGLAQLVECQLPKTLVEAGPGEGRRVGLTSLSYLHRIRKKQLSTFPDARSPRKLCTQFALVNLYLFRRDLQLLQD